VTLADGSHVSGSPLALTIAPGSIAPARCVAVGEGLRHAEVMRPTEFRVRMRDIGDNAVLSVVDPTSPTNAPLPLRLQLTPGGLPQQSAVVVDAGSGEFIVRYLVPISGRYQLRVLLGHERQNIQGSPFTIIVDHATAGGAGQAEGAQTERHSRRRSGDGDTGCAE